jgi:hypothetical protein
MVGLTQLLSGALRRKSLDKQNKQEEEDNAKNNLASQTEGLSVSDADIVHTDNANERYAVTWNDPSKFPKDAERVALLQSFAVLRTPAEERFDCITK